MRGLFFLLMSVTLATSYRGEDELHSSFKEKPPQFGLSVDMLERAPIYLYKVLSMDDWEKTCNTIHLSNMDANFIHLSTEEQLNRIIEKFWANATKYVVLKLEVVELLGDLVLEANPGGTNKYYHLYNGSIPLTAIIEMKVYKQ
jgi:uncharacterized protein (DUF952 family)